MSLSLKKVIIPNLMEFCHKNVHKAIFKMVI